MAQNQRNRHQEVLYSDAEKQGRAECLLCFLKTAMVLQSSTCLVFPKAAAPTFMLIPDYPAMPVSCQATVRARAFCPPTMHSFHGCSHWVCQLLPGTISSAKASALKLFLTTFFHSKISKLYLSSCPSNFQNKRLPKHRMISWQDQKL